MGKGDRRPIRDGDEWEKGDRRPVRDRDEWEKGDRRPVRDGDEWEKGDRRAKPRNRRQPGRPRLPWTAARTTEH